MMDLTVQRLEEIALNAWPALHQVLYDGWLLRTAKGYTKRANSVNPLYPSSLNLADKIAHCERYYGRQKLPAIFRLTPEATPSGLDQVLAGRGYTRFDPTRVMVRDTAQVYEHPAEQDLRFAAVTGNRWLAIHGELSHLAASDQRKHRQILRAIPALTCPATLFHNENAVACGLGVLEAGVVGLFDLVTAPDARRRGYGTRLIQELVRWGREGGAKIAYLQVMEANIPAGRLYEKLGFQTRYRYWYRIPA